VSMGKREKLTADVRVTQYGYSTYFRAFGHIDPTESMAIQQHCEQYLEGCMPLYWTKSLFAPHLRHRELLFRLCIS
jgi:hypothetical protein